MKKKIIITEEQLINLIRKRGRPKKIKSDDEIVPKTKKSRGRPRKNFDINYNTRDPYVPNWSYEQNLVAFYCYKFDPENLNVGPKYDTNGQLREIANHYIGTVTRSLEMQMSNFNYLDTMNTKNPKGLKDYSETQKIVYNDHKDDSEIEIRSEVLRYFSTLDTDEIFRVFIEKFNKINKIKEKKELQKNLDLSNKRAKDYERLQLQMKGMNPDTSKDNGIAKTNLINFLKNDNLKKVFNVLYGPVIRVFKNQPEFKRGYNGKLLPGVPDPKSSDYGQLTGEDILKMIENDPIDAVLDQGLYESTNKKIRLTEEQFKNVIKKSLEELNYQEFKNNENLEILRNALDKNKMVSVVFVKKDGTVRPMLIRKKLSSYQYSDREKSEKQLNIQSNNNILHVVDINTYKKALNDNGGNRGLAAKMSYRSINLETVLGFMASGHFFDLREENNIRERFGEQIYNSLTKTMVNKLAEIDQEARGVENNEPQIEPAGVENAEALNESQHKDLVKKLLKKSVLSESSKKMKNRIYKEIYRSGLTSKLYHDDHWGGVKSLIELVSSVEGVTEVNFGAKDGGYRQNAEGTQWKEYQVEIMSIDGKIEGILTAHAAGSVKDPFDRYDITLVLW